MPCRCSPVLHGDNGATLKATTVLAMLHWLGIKPSYSRPRVSDDNAFAEALFRTAKYRPEFPVKGFADLDCGQAMGERFVHWYNHEHRHSGIRYVTPAQRHAGRIAPCSPPATRSTKMHGNATRNAGVGRPATGRRSAPSPSIRSATPSSGRQPHKSSFPVRSASLLSRPDLAAPKPRRATKEMGGAEPPGATRSAPFAREHGEDGEHRTFSAVSTVAHSSPVGGSHLASRRKHSGFVDRRNHYGI